MLAEAIYRVKCRKKKTPLTNFKKSIFKLMMNTICFVFLKFDGEYEKNNKN